jgi:hypothetical protein
VSWPWPAPIGIGGNVGDLCHFVNECRRASVSLWETHKWKRKPGNCAASRRGIPRVGWYSALLSAERRRAHVRRRLRHPGDDGSVRALVTACAGLPGAFRETKSASETQWLLPRAGVGRCGPVVFGAGRWCSVRTRWVSGGARARPAPVPGGPSTGPRRSACEGWSSRLGRPDSRSRRSRRHRRPTPDLGGASWCR